MTSACDVHMRFSSLGRRATSISEMRLCRPYCSSHFKALSIDCVVQ